MVSSPAVVDGTVYVGSIDEHVYAIDASNGIDRWSFQTDGLVYSSPAVVDGTVYIGSDDGTVYALEAAFGTERWSFQTDGDVKSSPAVVDGIVYVGNSDGHVYALDTADGTERWSFQTDGSVSSLVVKDGRVYTVDRRTVYALGNSDTENGETERFETCSACQAELNDYDNPAFCPECGANLSDFVKETQIYDPN